MIEETSLFSSLKERYDQTAILANQATADGILTLWVDRGNLKDLLTFLKNGISKPFRMLYDLTAIDERRRKDNQRSAGK